MRFASVFCALVCAWASQPGLQREILDLSKIKRTMTENLFKLPDYTCVETIGRSKRETHGDSFRTIDLLRLEVAQIGEKELYSPLGGKRFEDNVTVLAHGGMISAGEFAGYARKVFSDLPVQPQFAGEEVLKGRRTLKYKYQMPSVLNGYVLVYGDKSFSVPAHGFFWADAETLDIIRLDKHADGIPPDLTFSQASSAIDYGRVRIGAAEVLLPQSAEVRLTSLNGEMYLNHVEFSQCRGYGVESSVRFGEASAFQEFKLPPNLTIPLLLDRPIGLDSNTAGDAITAHVAADVKLKNQIVIPQGATVRGRIRQLEDSIIALEFSELEFENRRAVFTARLEQAERLANGKILRGSDLPGVGTFSSKGEGVRLPSGFRMVWRTIDPDQKPR